MMKHKIVLMPLISVFILIFASCERNFIANDGEAWATTYHIVYSSDVDLSDSVKTQIDLIDRELSMFNPSSTVSLINSGHTDTVNIHFCNVFDCAAYVCTLSGGRYDPTVAPLVDLWGFGRAETAGVPTDSMIDVALESVGIGQCKILKKRLLIRKNKATDFDFSSLAKGYGVDCVAEMLERNGVDNYMVEIGGEIRVLGHSPKGSKWRIQIDEPVSGMVHSRFTVLELGPEPVAVATSGNYRNYRADSDGKVYGHTISPLNGRPVTTEVLSATVVAPTCMLADAIATACMTGSAAQADTLVRSAFASALIIVGGDGSSLKAKKIGCLSTTENP